jgi:hypothetical protein
VNGIAEFSRSGTLHVLAGHRSITRTLAGVTATSLVLATLQQDSGSFLVQSAVPAAGSFTINLNANAPTGGLAVAWIVLS